MSLSDTDSACKMGVHLSNRQFPWKNGIFLITFPSQIVRDEQNHNLPPTKVTTATLRQGGAL